MLLSAVTVFSATGCDGVVSELDPMESASGGGDGASTGGGAATGGGGAATGGGSPTGGGSATANDGGTLTFADAGTYGVPLNGYPIWRERSILVLTNAVRLSPTAYKQSPVYASGSPSLNTPTVLSATYPSRNPVFSQYDLNRSARQHSIEMATLNYFAHESADGGSTSSRISAYYSLSGIWGENIAAGNLDPIATMHQWLCDKPNGATACCDDGASCDGHRRNIMSANFRALGVGYGNTTTSTYKHYWTQDFGGVVNTATPPLVDGTHLLSGASQLRFLANFSAASAAQSVTLMLADVALPMALDLGTASKGTWFVLTPRAASCRPYYFIALDAAGLAWRYPAQGVFQTTGEGTCTAE